MRNIIEDVSLDGKVAVVTGAGRNIGREIALLLAEAGCDVAVNVHSNTAEGSSVVEAVEARGRRGILAVGDVAERARVQELHAMIRDTLGPVDILINNAAIRPHTPFLEIPVEEWNRVVDIGLTGAFHWSQVVAKEMVSRHAGNIVNVSGPDGFLGRRNRAHGCAVKAGLHGLTRAIAMDLGQYGIRCNTLVPHMTDTSRPAAWYPDHETDKARQLPEIPLGRFGSTMDLAKACLFLVSDWAEFITGQSLHVNGGRYML